MSQINRGLLTIFCLASMLLATALFSADFSGGSGTVNDPYQISTAQELANVRNYLSSSHHFKLMNDIDLADYLAGAGYNDGAFWSPIGPAYANQFSGKFDGNNKVVKNLKINRPKDIYIGLFGFLSSYAVVKNLGVAIDGFGINGGTHVGGLAGENNGEINNCYVIGSVSAKDEMIGGLVGYNKKNNGIIAKVSNSFTLGYVSGAFTTGGLIGDVSEGDIKNCYSGSIINGTSIIGGLVGGCSSSKIENCYASGKVSANTKVGGLVGELSYGASTTNCYWDTETTMQATSAGGTGKTTDEMRTQSTFSGWDFNSIWSIKSGQTISYPYLKFAEGVTVYTINYSAGENGTLTGKTNQYVASGINGSEVTAVPNIGYHFVQWSDSVKTATRADLKVGSNISVIAEFAVNSFELTANPDNKEKGRVYGSGTYNYGAYVTIFAMGKTGYKFVNWTYADSATKVFSTISTHSFQMPNNSLKLIANFIPEQGEGVTLTLVSSIPDAGVLIGSGLFNANQVVEISATANKGYKFVNWTKGVEVISTDSTYNYTLGSVNTELKANFTKNVAINEENEPQTTTLYQNYPNPFNPATTISYQLSSINYVKLAVYNTKGEIVKTLVDGVEAAGNHAIEFDGSALNSGIYFYKLEADGKNEVKKMMMVK